MVDGHLQETALEVAVWEALQRVIDPELGFSLVDLGLIRSVTVADGRALIELALTTPLCPLVGVFEHEIRTAALGVPGVREAEVRLVDAPWTPLASAPWRRWLDETT
ncbi:MAG: metal-sulfur cluster assembly factor [Roseiflexus sp.]|nr:metal-sulfur cluster assembly factor [Roseiflexus sp.]